jgi:hypothetical protein
MFLSSQRTSSTSARAASPLDCRCSTSQTRRRSSKTVNCKKLTIIKGAVVVGKWSIVATGMTLLVDTHNACRPKKDDDFMIEIVCICFDDFYDGINFPSPFSLARSHSSRFDSFVKHCSTPIMRCQAGTSMDINNCFSLD